MSYGGTIAILLSQGAAEEFSTLVRALPYETLQSSVLYIH
jgi:hypothetical protein